MERWWSRGEDEGGNEGERDETFEREATGAPTWPIRADPDLDPFIGSTPRLTIIKNGEVHNNGVPLVLPSPNPT